MRKSIFALAAVLFLSMIAGSVYAEKKHKHTYKNGKCTVPGCIATKFYVIEDGVATPVEMLNKN